MKNQFRILALALGVVAIWWMLWKTVDLGASRGSGDRATDFASPTTAVQTDSTEPSRAAPLDGETREALATTANESASSQSEREVSAPETGGIRLLGSLTDEDSKPIPVASLRLVDAGWEERTANSDGSGEYGFERLHAGTWELTVEAPEHRTLRRSVDLSLEDPDRRLDLVLARGDILKVRIVGEATLESPAILARSRAEASGAIPYFVPMVTREEPGRWIETEVEGGPSTAGTFLKRGGRPVGRSPNSTDAKTIGQLKSLGYVDPGKPVRVVEFLPEGTITDELPPEYCGVFVLSEPLPLFASLMLRDLVLKTEAVPAGADEVVFELTKEEVKALSGVVRLRVVDGETELPPVGMQVLLDQRLAGRRRTLREANGSITYEDVFPGSAFLTITADDRETVTERVVVQPGTVTDLGLYRLQPLALVRAKVLDDEGEPAQVTFNIFPLDRYAATRKTLDRRFFRSNADGDLKIDSVGRGRYLILASEEGWVSMPTVADTTLGRAEGIEIRVSKGTEVIVRLRAQPLPAARLEVRTRSGVPVAERRCRDLDPMRFVLVPGNYSIELWDGENWIASESLTVATEPLRLYFPK